MKYDQIPSGFVSALMKDENAVNAYAMMTKEEKEAVLEKARQVRSKGEMDRLMAQLEAEIAF